jgi:hypothetical protein
MQSGAAQAQMIILQFSNRLSSSPITTDAQNVSADILGDRAGPHLDKVISDLQTFLQDVAVVLAPINELVSYGGPDGGAPDLKSAAGATKRYLGPVLKNVKDAVTRVESFLDPFTMAQLKSELTRFSRARDLLGKDGNLGTCLGSPL